MENSSLHILKRICTNIDNKDKYNTIFEDYKMYKNLSSQEDSIKNKLVMNMVEHIKNGSMMTRLNKLNIIRLRILEAINMGAPVQFPVLRDCKFNTFGILINMSKYLFRFKYIPKAKLDYIIFESNELVEDVIYIYYDQDSPILCDLEYEAVMQILQYYFDYQKNYILANISNSNCLDIEKLITNMYDSIKNAK
jgi:hypothetical protein